MLSTLKSVSKSFRLSSEVVMGEVFETVAIAIEQNDITEQINVIIHHNIPQ